MRSYKTTLAPKLRARYGRENHYTPEQVKGCAIDSGVSMTFICLAFAMYCDRETFDAYHRAEGEACDYDAMRAEVGSVTGLQAATFDASDLVDSTDHQPGFDGHHDGGHDGGSDGGGSDGGDD